MSSRQEYLIPQVRGDNLAISGMLRMIAHCMDSADQQYKIVIHPESMSEFNNENLANNWMLVAFLIADVTEISTPKLIEIANSVFRGEQVVLKF